MLHPYNICANRKENPMTDASANRTRNIQYKALQGCYWMFYGMATQYASVFLLSHGFRAYMIGILMAVSNFIAAGGQMYVGTLADRYARLTWKNICLFICGMEALCLAGLFIFNRSMIMNGCLYPVLLILVFAQMPLINSAVFYYKSRGEHIDFGSARGTGSLAYALMSFVLGHVVVRYGEQSIVTAGIILTAALFTVVFIMPCSAETAIIKEDESAGARDPSANAPAAGFIAFVRKYPWFMLSLLGVITMLAFNAISHTYMIQLIESLGGDSADMGTIFSIETLAELPIMFGFFYIQKKFRINTLMVISGFGFVLKALCFALASSVTMLYVLQVFQIISYAMLASASVYYSNEQVEECDAVKGQGYMTAAMSIGSMAGNLAGGFIYDFAGLHAMLFFTLVLVSVGAFIMLLSILKSDKTRLSKSKSLSSME